MLATRARGRIALGAIVVALAAAAAASAASPPASGSPASAAPSTARPNAALGRLQTELKKLGYYKAQVDGFAGPVTTAAVAAFQRANGLAADGVAGPLTKAAIAAALKGGNVGAAVHQAQSAAAPPPTTGPLSVSQLQKDLWMLSFYDGKIDGVSGPATVAAVQRLQRAAGLTPDGVVGPATEVAIARLLKTRG